MWLGYARININKTVQYAFVKKFSKSDQQQIKFGDGKKFKGEDCLQSKRIWLTSSIGREGRAGSAHTLVKPQKVHKNNKYGSSDFSNDRMAGSKETLGNNRSGHNGR